MSASDANQAVQNLHRFASQMAQASPTKGDIQNRPNEIKSRIDLQDEHFTTQLDQVDNQVRTGLAENIAQSLRSYILEQLRKEIALEVTAQVKSQTHAILGDQSLRQQGIESQQHVASVEAFLKNSRARQRNSALKPQNREDPLVPLVQLDGTVSKRFPEDLDSLFMLNEAEIKELLKDYGQDSGYSRDGDINRFMEYIGIEFTIGQVPMPMLT
jgi:hypothetical protein